MNTRTGTKNRTIDMAGGINPKNKFPPDGVSRLRVKAPMCKNVSGNKQIRNTKFFVSKEDHVSAF
jgi:hypothetical protein